ncbi:MAG: prepilin peptidase [Patescibacteria group bacterium]|nr:prepilin peptidase [Patescibacteria group bacterium]
MIYFTYIFIFILGTIIGSFINCLIYRLHEKKSMGGRSFCPKCKHQIAWYDNIPVLSFVFLKAKCRYCKQKISWQYPVVELVTGILFLIIFILNYKTSLILNTQYLILLLRNWFIIAIMTIIFLYDLKYYLILDKITLPSIMIFSAINLYLGMNWQNLLISAIIGGSFFLIQFVVSKGRWIGGGDIRLGVLMGVILGWPMVILAIFIAYISGSVVSVGLIITGKKQWGSQVPLGIFLTTATIIVLFWGEIIWNWYWHSVIFNIL